jgi:predicted site-specific integrase-resolvase
VFQSLSSNGSRRLLFVHHVARRLGVSCRTVRWWARTGQIPAFRLHVKVWAFYEGDVLAFAARRDADRAA